MKKIQILAVQLRGVANGETPPADGVQIQAADVLAALGVEPELFTQKDATPKSIAEALAAKFEKNASLRITEAVKKDTISELTQSVYSRVEDIALKAFGLDASMLDGVDTQKRFSTIIEAAKLAQVAQIEAVKNGDVKNLLRQNEDLNKSIAELKAQHAAALQAKEAESKAFVDKFAFKNALSLAVLNAKNSLTADTTAETVKAVFEYELSNQGGFKVLEAADGREVVYITDRNGNIAPDPDRPTENLKLENFLNFVLKKHNLIARSNATSGEVAPPILGNASKLAKGVKPI